MIYSIGILLDSGHKRIGMISGDRNFVSTIQRESGYKKALEDAGLHFETQLVKQGAFGFKGGFGAAGQFLDMSEKPTAIFAISDLMAIGAIKAMKQAKIKVPDDMSVIGFDNISFSSMYDPMLSTVFQPKYEIGSMAMELLIKQINGEKEAQEIFLEHQLIIRESTINYRGINNEASNNPKM